MLDSNTIDLFIKESHDILMRFDKELRHTYVSETVTRLFNYKPNEFLNKTHRELDFPNHVCEFWENSINEVFKTGLILRTELEIDTKFGKRSFLLKIFPEKDKHNNTISVLSILKDITPYRTISDKYNSLFNQMPDGYAHHQIITDKSGKPIDYVFIEVNPAFEKLTGLKKNDIIGQRILSIMPNTENYWIEKYGKVALAGEPLQYSNYSKELNKYFEVTAFQSTPGFFITIFKDITDIVKAEKLHSTIVDYITDCLVLIDQSYTIIWANKKAKNYFGENMVGRKCYEVYQEKSSPCKNNCHIYNLLSSNESESPEYECQRTTLLGLKDFLKRSVILPHYSGDKSQNNILEISKDITEYKLNQKKLTHSQKMMAMGQLAGGIAHDFNNMLMAIQGFINFAQDTLDPNSSEHRFLSRALQASERSSNLVKQILAFSRQTKHENQPLFLLPIVKEALNLLDMSLTSSIQIERHLYNEEYTIDGDPTTIHEIVVNLCTNAAHAMNSKGKIIVEHKEIEIDNILETTTGPIQAGIYSLLSISDSGHGIKKELEKKIFDPFFTTKSQNEGTGMGLSVVLSIVKNYSGGIIVKSKINKGTTFDIYLPKNNTIELNKNGSKNTISYGNENILVIDDEEYLLETLEGLLRKLGYNVRGFTNPNEALKHYLSNSNKYDCIISDNIMPELNGVEIIQHIRDKDDNTPAIICTGYSSKMDKDLFSKLKINTLLLKPFTIEDISKSVRDAIDNNLDQN